LDQLPVQEILYFTQPPTPVVAAYVSAICRAEGIQPEEQFFTRYSEPAVDLRWYINQCQFGTSPLSPNTTSIGTPRLRETPRNTWEDVLEKSTRFPRWEFPLRDESRHKALLCYLSKQTDNISYLDSRLVLRIDTVSEVLRFDNPQVAENCGFIGLAKYILDGR
jgi:hypothetical protein